MSVLLVLSHPDPRSLNHAVADRISTVLAEEGITVFRHDLYAEHFEPVLEHEEIRRRFSFDDVFTTYVRELHQAGGIVLIYPDWWGMPPAILKGWVDRIFRPGIAFDHEGKEFMPKRKVPLLGGKRVLVCTTTNETNPLSQEAMQMIWQDRIFSYAGIDNVTFKTFYNVRESSGRMRRSWLTEMDDVTRRLFSEF
ncbi:MAG: NAD(P)H-dependent oxidoreductase [Spirochaeta sp.]|nr:NAD(P)H-dependent oxidoreductase [Spirochaeta sp.]